MTNWKENNYPFKKFTKELTEEWISKGFDKKETRKWLESDLQPTDAGYAQWLRDVKKMKAKWVLNEGDEENLREQYNEYLEKGECINNWRDIHSEFTSELQEKWEENGFDYHQTKDWINVGLKLEEDDFARWLKEQQKSPEHCLNYGNIEKLRKEYDNYIKNLYLERGITYENIQQWLDKNYSDKEKVEWIGRQTSRGFDRIGNRREIDNAYENELAGKLVVKDFPNLEKILHYS